MRSEAHKNPPTNYKDDQYNDDDNNNNNNNSYYHTTYIVGEDEGRLAAVAQDLGLEQGRMPRKSWKSMLFNDDTLTAARMHSVGYIGDDERVDEHGTLHHTVTLRRPRRERGGQDTTTAMASTLVDLFTKPPSERGVQEGQEEQEGEAVEEEEPEEEIIDMVEGGSLLSAAFGIVKGTVGPAILYLPAGFYGSGWAVAIPAMAFATGMFVLNAYRLLDCWKVESDRNHQVESRMREVQALLQKSPQSGRQPMYGAAAVRQERFFVAKLLTYPELAKRALGPYSLLVELGIALFQFGVCLTYLIFVPDNLHAALFDLTGYSVNKMWLLWMMIVIEIPLAWIRDIRKLTPTNVVASFLIAFGLAAVLVMAVWEGSRWNDETDELVFAQNIKTLQPLTNSWFLFIGTSFFMMEGSITLLVPLQEAVYRPEDRARFPDVNRNITWSIVAFYVLFSAVACAAFGSHIHTALTASLQGTLATIVQMAYSVAVILTFPLQAFPAMEVALRVMYQITGQGDAVLHTNAWRHNVFTTLIVLSLGMIAVCSLEYLGNVVSILGSLFGIPLALVFPPLMHNALVKDSTTITRWINYSVVVVGIFAMAAASFNTIVTWNHGDEQG